MKREKTWKRKQKGEQREKNFFFEDEKN